jgi:hypothetical protein
MLLNKAVLGALMATLFTDGSIDRLTEEVNAKLSKAARQPVASTKDLEREIASRERQVSRLAAKLERVDDDGTIDAIVDQVRSMERDLAAKREELASPGGSRERRGRGWWPASRSTPSPRSPNSAGVPAQARAARMIQRTTCGSSYMVTVGQSPAREDPPLRATPAGEDASLQGRRRAPSLLQRPPDGTDSCASRRPRHTPGACPAMGGFGAKAAQRIPC